MLQDRKRILHFNNIILQESYISALQFQTLIH